MLVRFLARFRDAADTFTPTATWNEREDLGSTVRTGAQFHLQDKLATGTGSQAAVTVAPSVTSAARYLAVSLALREAGVDKTLQIDDTLGLADSCSPVKTGPPSAYQLAVLADSPAAYYRFGESSGQPQDLSGNGNHTTVTNGTPTLGQPGAIPAESDTAVAFFGGNNFLAPDHASLDLGDTFSLEAWIKPSALGSGVDKPFVAKGVGAYMLRLNAADKLELVKDRIAVLVVATVAVTDTTTFHHVVGTKSGSTLKLYMDGVDVTGTVTNSACGDTADFLYLGCDATGSPWFNGVVDEVAVYPTALSSTRVAAHYAAATAAAPLTRSVDDTLAVSDAQSFQRDVALAIPDTLGLADALRFDQTEAIADTLAVADLATTQSGKSQAIPDTLGLADSLRFDVGEAVADTLAVADATATQAAFVRQVDDALPLTDTLAQAEEIHIGDTLALSDLCTPVKGVGVIDWAQPVADTLGLADALVFDRLEALSDTLGLADATSSQAVFQRSVPDTLALADALSSQAAFLRSVADTVTPSDVVTPAGAGAGDHGHARAGGCAQLGGDPPALGPRRPGRSRRAPLRPGADARRLGRARGCARAGRGRSPLGLAATYGPGDSGQERRRRCPDAAGRRHARARRRAQLPGRFQPGRRRRARPRRLGQCPARRRAGAGGHARPSRLAPLHPWARAGRHARALGCARLPGCLPAHAGRHARARRPGRPAPASGRGRAQPGRCDLPRRRACRRRLRGLGQGLAVAVYMLRPVRS